MRRLLIYLFLVLVFSGNLVYARKFSEAPPNPEYIKYLGLKKARQWKDQIEMQADPVSIPHIESVAFWKSADEVSWDQVGAGTAHLMDSCVKVYGTTIDSKELSNIVDVEYFFNEDPGYGNGISIPVTPAIQIEKINLSIDISTLDYGFNHLYVRAKDDMNRWSLTNVKSFYKETVFTELPNITKVEYFIDEDPGDGNGISIPVTPSPNIGGINFIADISGYANGFHHLYVRTKDVRGNWSLANIKSFYKETLFTDLPNITKVEYFIDEDPGEGNGIQIPVTPSPNIVGINFMVDISEYENGFHRLYVRTKDARGRWSLANIKSFYKETVFSNPQKIVRAEYFFNTDPGEGNGLSLQMIPEPNIQGFTFIGDVLQLPLGENTLFVRVLDENGHWSITNIRVFDVQCADVSVNFEPTEGCATMPLEFIDLSTHMHPLSEYRWYFGDGTPVVIKGVGNTTHTYGAIGEYEVKLVIKSREGCIDSITKNVTIHEPPTVFAGEDQTVCIGDEVTLEASYSFANLSWNHGVINGQSFIATETTVYTATAESIFGCGPVSDQVVVTVIPLPLVFAGNDAIGCGNEPFAINSASAEDYSSLSWQAVNGNGAFNNPNQLISNYNPDPSDPAVVTICLSAEPLTPCTIVMSDCFDLTLTAPPSVTIQEPLSGATICASTNLQLVTTLMNSSGVLWTTSGDGGFANATQANTSYIPGSSDISNGQVTLCLEAQPLGGCTLPGSDCITLNIQPDPVIMLNADFWLDCADYDFDLEQWLPYQLSATVENASSYEWNTNGDGYFDDPSSLITDYHLGDDDILNGEVVLTLSVSGPDQCNLVVSEQSVLHIPGQLIPVTQVGWRGISSYMDNADKTVPEVLAPIQNSLAIIMDAQNKTYNPTTGVNTIGNWSSVGYRANFINNQSCLPVYGSPVSSKVFEIEGSPTYLPVLTDVPINIEDLFNGHLDKIEQIYNWSTFQSWTPDNAGFNELKPGFAYSLVTSSGFTIEFPPFSWEGLLSELVISGSITNEANGEPVENVELMATGINSVFSDEEGNYALSVPFGWSGNIMPVKDEWEFSPLVISLENVVVNIFDQDFQGVTTACDPAWDFTITNLFHTISIPLSANPNIFGEPLEAGDWIGVFYLDDYGNEQCGGNTQWTGNSNVVVNAYGDDQTSPEKDGFANGEPICWKIYGCSSQETFTAFATYDPYMPQQGVYYDWGFSALTALECQVCQEIMLLENWNDVSLFVDPLNDYVANIFAPLVNELVIFRNLTSVFWPEYSINTIGDWNIESGYVLKVTGQNSLEICGSPLENYNLSLSVSESSWHYLPVLSSCPVDVSSLLNPIINDIVIVKDLIGYQVWWPQMGIYSLGELLPGQAYEIKISDNITLSFPECAKTGVKHTNQILNAVESDFGEVKFTPVTHTIAFPANVLQGLPANSKIGVFDNNGKILGLSQEISDIALGVIANGDDPKTTEVEGFVEGDIMNFQILESKSGIDARIIVNYDITLPNAGYFVNHGLSAVANIELTGLEDLGSKPFLVNVHPNPSTGIFNVNLDFTDPVDCKVFDIHGVSILNLRSQSNDFTIDLSSYPKGIYYLKITQGGLQVIRKLVIQ